MDRPLLALAMIVKNEAGSIAKTIESVRPWIDRASIVDTGSTDDTAAIALNALDGVDGCVSTAPFVDFATTRNVALDLAEMTGAAFVLMLSADELLVNGAALRAFCEASLHGDEGAYYIRVRALPIIYDSARLTRTGAGWRYVGETHEVPRGPNGELRPTTPRIPDVRIAHQTGPHSRSVRWHNDLPILEAAVARDPTDSRSLFYLAQTLECLGRTEEAMGLYAKRAEMDCGHDEERWEATFRVAREAERLDLPWEQVEALYVKAWKMDPRRAEPLSTLACRAYGQEDYAKARFWCEAGALLEIPDVHTPVDIRAYGPDGRCSIILSRLPPE